MSIQKPGIPKGTRDFGPVEMSKRNFIFDQIKSVFMLHGYSQIETPAMENLDTLLGKYGEEGDKLLFKILNSGDFLSGINSSDLPAKGSNAVSLLISEKGLRYDLTVPFARYVVQHQNEIVFPFKRYQLQPVWRADRPQKGRYREFYQCDADIIGSNSLFNEADLIAIIDEVFRKLDLGVIIKLNNRKILAGIAEYIGQPEKITDITVAIDKLEKIGSDAVMQELQTKGLNVESINKLEALFAIKGDNNTRLAEMKKLLHHFAIGVQGIEETEQLLDLISSLSLSTACELDISLARGLNYYTGTIIEVKALEAEIGSVCGGGRYDDLTGIFGLKNVSGVGISFGADRIYDVMNQLNRFPEHSEITTQVLFANFGDHESRYCLKLITQLRQRGISAELYHDKAKLARQFSYAESKNIRYMAIIGENEIAEAMVTLKDIVSGEQKKVSYDKLVEILNQSE